MRKVSNWIETVDDLPRSGQRCWIYSPKSGLVEDAEFYGTLHSRFGLMQTAWRVGDSCRVVETTSHWQPWEAPAPPLPPGEDCDGAQDEGPVIATETRDDIQAMMEIFRVRTRPWLGWRRHLAPLGAWMMRRDWPDAWIEFCIERRTILDEVAEGYRPSVEALDRWRTDMWAVADALLAEIEREAEEEQ